VLLAWCSTHSGAVSAMEKHWASWASYSHSHSSRGGAALQDRGWLCEVKFSSVMWTSVKPGFCSLGSICWRLGEVLSMVFFYIGIGIFNRCQVLNCSGALPDGAALWIRCLCSIVVMLFLGGIRIAAVVVESSWVRVTWRGRLYLFNWLSAHLLNVGNHIFKEQCNPQL